MDRLADRQKPLKYDRDLTALIRAAVISARDMGHDYVRTGHLGINLNAPSNPLALETQRAYFRELLPPTGSFDETRKPKIGIDVLSLLASASRKASLHESAVVSIQHITDTMKDPKDPSFQPILGFIETIAEPPLTVIIRKSKRSEAA